VETLRSIYREKNPRLKKLSKVYNIIGFFP